MYLILKKSGLDSLVSRLLRFIFMRNHYLNRSLYFILLFISTSLLAVEFGEMKVNSYLYQPLRADMAISNVEGNERVELAGKESYIETDVDYFAVYEKIKLRQQQNKLIFSSVEPVNHPFLQLLLVVRKQGGEQFRLFTLLLDPIDYTSESPQIARRSPAPEKSRKTEQSKTKASQYQIQPNDTLSQIVLDNMPSEKISLNERMNSIFEQNPDAFIDNDINKIKVGYTLDIPGVDEDLQQQTEKNTEQQASKKPVKFKQPVAETQETPDEDAGGRIQLSVQELSDESEEEQASDEAETVADAQSLALVDSSKLDELTNTEESTSLELTEDKTLEEAQTADTDEAKALLAVAEEELSATEEEALAEDTQATDDLASTTDELETEKEDTELIKAENQELQEKLTSLRDKIAQLEQKLQVNSQQSAMGGAEPEGSGKVLNVIDNANNLVSENIESEEENDLMWIIAAIAVVVLLIIYVIYKWIESIRRRREAYDQIQDIELFNADLDSSHLESEANTQTSHDEMAESDFTNQSEGVGASRSRAVQQTHNEDEPAFFSQAPVGKPQPIVEESTPPLEPVPPFEEVPHKPAATTELEPAPAVEPVESPEQSHEEVVSAPDSSQSSDDILAAETIENNEDAPKRETLSYSFEDLGIDTNKEQNNESPEPVSQESSQSAPVEAEKKASGLQLEEVEPSSTNTESSANETSGVEEAEEVSDADIEQVENLLNAAKRDVMIGNKAQALRSLEEVLQKGNAEQKTHARELMNHLGE